jgi:hypothetical protein
VSKVYAFAVALSATSGIKDILPVEPPKTDSADSPPVKLEATEVVAPRAVTEARVSVSAGSAALVQFEPSEVRTLPEAPGVTIGILPDAVPLSAPASPALKVWNPAQTFALARFKPKVVPVWTRVESVGPVMNPPVNQDKFPEPSLVKTAFAPPCAVGNV